MLNPVAMAIIADTFTVPAERARAIGVFGSMSGLSLALGPVLGGALVDGLGWRSIFWINVPIVIVAIVLTARFVPESRAPRARRVDPVGQLLVILALGSVVYAIIEANQTGWTSPIDPRPARGRGAGHGGHPRRTSRVGPTRCWSCACSAACRSARRS